MKQKLLYFSVCIILSLLLLTSGCKTVTDIISGKDYGNYTSITVRIIVKYKGLNSTGIRKLTFADVVRLNENFTIAGTADSNSTCDTAILDKEHIFEIVISGTTLNIKHEFINWDYTKYSKWKTNYKMLCTEWTGSIVSYTFESGKDDPGSPVMSGFDLLGLDIGTHCVADGRQHDCLVSAVITFVSPYLNTDDNAADMVFASKQSTYSSD